MVHELRKMEWRLSSPPYLEEAERHANRIAFISGGSSKWSKTKRTSGLKAWTWKRSFSNSSMKVNEIRWTGSGSGPSISRWHGPQGWSGRPSFHRWSRPPSISWCLVPSGATSMNFREFLRRLHHAGTDHAFWQRIPYRGFERHLFSKWTGVIYELLTAPLSYSEICLGYVLAATTRAMIVAVIIFLVSLFYVDLTVKYPLFCLLFAFITLFLCLFGFVIGLVANSFSNSRWCRILSSPRSHSSEGYSITSNASPFWRNVSIFNPFVYMNNGLRYGFGITDVDPVLCVIVILLFILNLAFLDLRTGFRLRQ